VRGAYLKTEFKAGLQFLGQLMRQTCNLQRGRRIEEGMEGGMSQVKRGQGVYNLIEPL
jgi:hypothetical protein